MFRDIIMREARRRGWSAYKLAQEAGMPQRTVQAFFKGDRDLTSERVALIFKALGLAVVHKPTRRKGLPSNKVKGR